MPGAPVTVVPSGAPPFVSVASGAPVFTNVASGGSPICLVASGAPPIVLEGYSSNLITNGDFTSGANWTLTAIGGGNPPTISGGNLVSTAGTEGNLQRATQTLVGGSVPAATYTVTLSTTVASGIDVTLLGAADEIRGSGNVPAGVAQSTPIIASGEVSKIRLDAGNDGNTTAVTLV